MWRSIVILSLLVAFAAAHSWVACADYANEGDLTWDWLKCRGYGRYAKTMCAAAGTNDLASFGKECTMSYNNQAGCHTARPATLSDAYSSQYPMATYSQGQRVCLAWPAKNHAAATCTNQYIPDNGIQISVSSVNPTADPTQDQFDSKKITPFGNGVHATATIDFKGFQNCSLFCENTGNAFCSGCFDLPKDMAVGLYTFQWSWFFNTATDSYRTCFDANVVAGNGTSPSPLPSPTPSPPTSSNTSSGTTPSGPCAAQYSQCGGQGFTGPTTCCAPYNCHITNGYYSQCLSGDAPPASPPSTPSTSSTPTPTPSTSSTPTPTPASTSTHTASPPPNAPATTSQSTHLSSSSGSSSSAGSSSSSELTPSATTVASPASNSTANEGEKAIAQIGVLLVATLVLLI